MEEGGGKMIRTRGRMRRKPGAVSKPRTRGHSCPGSPPARGRPSGARVGCPARVWDRDGPAGARGGG
eukprot:7531913-Pyramimonas_sp.AAC.1